MSLQCRSGHSKPLSVKEQIGGFPQSPISTRLPKRSNALGKWLKKDLSLTAQSLRHTFSDRLRASKCPLELIDQIWWLVIHWHHRIKVWARIRVGECKRAVRSNYAVGLSVGFEFSIKSDTLNVSWATKEIIKTS